MPKQSEELQKIENKDESKETLLTKTSKYLYARSPTDFIVIGGILMTVITAIIGFLSGLAWFFYIPLGAAVLALFSAIYYFLSSRPKIKILNTEIESLKEEVSKLQGELKDNNWLFDKAEREREYIENYVFLLTERIDCLHHIPHKTLTRIRFQMMIFNASVYDLAVEKSVSGKMFFNDLELQGAVWIDEPPQRIEPNTECAVWIIQELSKDEVREIEEVRKQYRKDEKIEPVFYFAKLKIKIRGGEKYPEVSEGTLKIGREVKATLAGSLLELK